MKKRSGAASIRHSELVRETSEDVTMGSTASSSNSVPREHSPFFLKGVDHIVILVDDLGAAERFYVQTLRCSISDRIPRLGMTELRAGSSSVDVVDISAPEGAWARPNVPGGRNMDHFCLNIDGGTERDLRQHLAACGARIRGERRERTSNGEELSLYVSDPSGNLVELLKRI